MKKSISKLHIICLMLISANFLTAQIPTKFLVGDSKDTTYHYLEKAATNTRNEKQYRIQNAKIWLKKSQIDSNWFQVVKCYKVLLHLNDKTKMLHYADSSIIAAKKTNNNLIIGTAYLTKGAVYFERKEILLALDNYLLANSFISKTNDQYAIHKTKYSIANTKYYLGFYDEAISLLKGCLEYFEEENDRAYLNTIHSLGLCYNKLVDFNRCTYFNELGMEESYNLEIPEMLIYFKHSQGINLYYLKEYDASLKALLEVLPIIKDKNDFANTTITNFYIGKNFWQQNKLDLALPYLLEVDKSFKEKKYITPTLREAYELLIKFYAKNNDEKLQLFFIKQLLEVDKIIHHNYKYLSNKVFKEYDTKRLLDEKKKIERYTKIKTKILYYFLGLLAIVIVTLVIVQIRNKKRYEIKFQELMNANSVQIKINKNNFELAELDINPAVIEVILKNLDKFEKYKKYLEKDMTLIRIAAVLNTNTKYASKVIYKYRGKKSIDYISDLKIEHIISLLREEKKYRHYTNKALAEEVGFGSTQNFTRAFKNKTGISPTFLIAKLNKS